MTAFAWRAARLTPQRAEEIAGYAAAAIPHRGATGPGATSMTAYLIGMARWLHGERPSVGPGRPPTDMTPLEFETANEPRWRQLEQAVELPERQLNPELFLSLYRTCCEHLALAQARGFADHVIERLSIVTARAHQIVYRQSEFGLTRTSRALLQQFPAMVRAHRGYVAVAALILMVPALALGIATYNRPELILSLVDSSTAAQFEHMYSPLNPAIGRMRDAGSDWMMFGFYIMNNIGIAFQCYVTGILFGVGSVYFLAFNGAFAGAIAGFIAARGYGGTFFPFIATHSAFEVTAIVLCGAAGLRIGQRRALAGAHAAIELAADRLARDEHDRIRRRRHAGDRRGNRGILVIRRLGHASGKILLCRGLLDVGCPVFPAAPVCGLRRLSLVLRPRSTWEGCDLGVRLLQSWLTTGFFELPRARGALVPFVPRHLRDRTLAAGAVDLAFQTMARSHDSVLAVARAVRRTHRSARCLGGTSTNLVVAVCGHFDLATAERVAIVHSTDFAARRTVGIGTHAPDCTSSRVGTAVSRAP